MLNHDPNTRQRPPRGELWLLAFILVLIATLGLLHLAVEREREAGIGLIESQAFSKMLTGIQDGPAPLQMQGQSRNMPPTAPEGAGNPNSPT